MSRHSLDIHQFSDSLSYSVKKPSNLFDLHGACGSLLRLQTLLKLLGKSLHLRSATDSFEGAGESIPAYCLLQALHAGV